MSLLCQLGLEHESSLRGLIEEISPVGKPVIAELLSDALRVGAFGTLLDEVVKEAEDLEVEALQAIIFIIIQLLRNRVIISL